MRKSFLTFALLISAVLVIFVTNNPAVAQGVLLRGVGAVNT
jgi:hypothetical protein